MLKITTSQKDSKVLDQVFRQVLPIVDTPHQIIPFEGELPTAGAGDVVLGLGGTVLDHIKASPLFPMVKNNKNVSLNSQRGKWLPYGAARLMLSYDPFMASMDPAMEPEIVWDIRLACRLHDTGALQPVIGKYRWVKDFAAVIAYVEDQYETTGKPVPVSPDLETIGLDWLHPGDEDRPPARIVTISFSPREGYSDVYRVPASGLPPPEVLEQISWLLTSPKVNSVGANLKFDINWMAHHWDIECSNQRADTMLIGSLQNENRSNSLNLHAKQYTPMGGYDDDFNDRHDKSRMDLALAADPDGFLVYAGGDTDAALRTYNRMRPALVADKSLTAFYSQLLQPAAKVFTKVERRGVVVDRARYLELQVEVQAEIEKLTAKALSHVPKRLQYKYADKNSFLSSPAAMEEFLFTPNGLNLKPLMMTPSGRGPSTAIEHLEMFSDNPDAKEFVDVVRALNGAKKTMSTYIVGFLKHLRADGRFHPTYMLHRGEYGANDSDSGTVTGRTSAKDPAYQTIPKHTKWAKPLRTVYTCPPGMAILKADFSQGELRVTACVAGERNMIKTYQKGIDLHLRTGALVNGITLEEALTLMDSKDPEAKAKIKKIRQGGKAGNFGLIYGMSAGGFMDFARKTYGVHLSEQHATDFRNAFFAEYPSLLDWHASYKGHAHKHGYVRSPLGRIRHLPLINSKRGDLRSESERQSINSPIQSCLSDMMMLGMVELDRAYPDLWIFGMTHDDVGMYVPEDEVEEWAVRVRDVLQDLPLKKFGWSPVLTFVADTEASYTNLAECEALKLAA